MHRRREFSYPTTIRKEKRAEHKTETDNQVHKCYGHHYFHRNAKPRVRHRLPRSRIERYAKGNLDSGKVGEEGGIINLEECSEGEGERNRS